MPAMWITAGSALLGALGSGSSQGGSQTMDRSPWGPSQDWLKQNIQTGQDLQGHYQRSPFNNLQQGAYQNLYAGNDYLNGMMPGLLAQMSQPVGFDRSNPHARPAPMQFPQMAGMGQPGGMQPMQGLLGNLNQTQNPFANGGILAAAAAPPAQQTSQYQADPQWLQQMMATIGAGG